MNIAVPIVVILILAAVALLATARRRTATGRLSRETRRADASETPPAAAPGTELAEGDSDEEARTRADEAQTPRSLRATRIAPSEHSPMANRISAVAPPAR